MWQEPLTELTCLKRETGVGMHGQSHVQIETQRPLHRWTRARIRRGKVGAYLAPVITQRLERGGGPLLGLRFPALLSPGRATASDSVSLDHCPGPCLEILWSRRGEAAVGGAVHEEGPPGSCGRLLRLDSLPSAPETPAAEERVVAGLLEPDSWGHSVRLLCWKSFWSARLLCRPRETALGCFAGLHRRRLP